MGVETFREAVERAALAEVAYRGPTGRIDFATVTPLLLGAEPCLALTLDRLDLARALAGAPSTALVLSDSRLAFKGWTPHAAVGRMELLADAEGELFQDRLMEQELLKHAPARTLIDSPLLRRENWWYIPRVVLRLVGITDVHPVDRREPGHQGVLAWMQGGVLDADTVEVEDWDAQRIRFKVERGLPPGADASLFSADMSIPDLERRAEFTASGRLDGYELVVDTRSGTLQVEEPLRVTARLKRLRSLEKSCRRGLKTLETQRALI